MRKVIRQVVDERGEDMREILEAQEWPGKANGVSAQEYFEKHTEETEQLVYEAMDREFRERAASASLEELVQISTEIEPDHPLRKSVDQAVNSVSILVQVRNTERANELAREANDLAKSANTHADSANKYAILAVAVSFLAVVVAVAVG